jgi:O-antigen/teichoic acid export membrane protein
MNKKISAILKSPLITGSFLMIVGSMGINVVNYVYHLLMGRILGPVDYGVLASVFSLLYIISIVPQSASVTIVKFISSSKNGNERDHISYEVTQFVKKVALGGSILIIIASPVVAGFLNLPSVIPVLLVAPIFYYSIITTAHQAIMQGVLSFFGVVVTNAISSVGKLVLGLLLIYVGLNVSGAIFAVGLGVWLAYLASIFFLRKKVSLVATAKSHFELSDFFMYSGPVLIQAFAFTSLFTIDLIIVKHFFNAYDAGVYAALSTLGKIIFFASSPVASVMFPIVARRHTNGESARNVLIISLVLTGLASGVFVAIYYYLPHLTVSMLYGSKYIGAENALPWMGMFIAIYSFCQLLVNYFLSVGRLKVAYLPFVAALAQIVLLTLFHSSLIEVIQISLAILSVMFVLLLGILSYNQLTIYGKKIIG